MSTLGCALVTMVVLAGCAAPQSFSAKPTDDCAGGPAAQSPTLRDLDAELPLLEYSHRCPGMSQARHLSVRASGFSWIDEAGEARAGLLTSGEIDELIATLRREKFAEITTSVSRSPGRRCSTSITALLDGTRHTIEESGTRQVDAAWQSHWQTVIRAIEAFVVRHQ